MDQKYQKKKKRKENVRYWETRPNIQRKRTEKSTEDARLLAMKTLAVHSVFGQVSTLSEC